MYSKISHDIMYTGTSFSGSCSLSILGFSIGHNYTTKPAFFSESLEWSTSSWHFGEGIGLKSNSSCIGGVSVNYVEAEVVNPQISVELWVLFAELLQSPAQIYFGRNGTWGSPAEIPLLVQTGPELQLQGPWH